MTTRSIGTYKPAEATVKKVDVPADSKPKGSGWTMTPEEEAIFERARKMKAESQSMILQSQATRKQLGGNLKEHFKFLLVMGPTELDKEIKARFKAWDSDGGGYLDKNEMSQAMEEMGKKPTPEELEALMKEVDLDGNGTVGNLSSFSVAQNGLKCVHGNLPCFLHRAMLSPPRQCARQADCAFNAPFGIACTDLGEFGHMIRKQLDIGHTCNCTYCENKRKEEEAADAVAVCYSERHMAGLLCMHPCVRLLVFLPIPTPSPSAYPYNSSRLRARADVQNPAYQVAAEAAADKKPPPKKK